MTTESLSAGYKSNLKINTAAIMCSNNCDKRIWFGKMAIKIKLPVVSCTTKALKKQKLIIIKHSGQ